MAGRDYLAPNHGSIQPTVQRGTGPSPFGRVINPPDFSKFGGFVSPNPMDAGMGDNNMRIQKPGFEK